MYLLLSSNQFISKSSTEIVVKKLNLLMNQSEI